MLILTEYVEFLQNMLFSDRICYFFTGNVIFLQDVLNSYINSHVVNWQPTLGHKEQGIQVTVKLISRKNLVGNTAGNCQ